MKKSVHSGHINFKSFNTLCDITSDNIKDDLYDFFTLNLHYVKCVKISFICNDLINQILAVSLLLGAYIDHLPKHRGQ